MKLDAKQKVLIAIYTEYQKDMPNMNETITSERLCLDEEVFVMALRKLENEQLIQNINFLWADNKIYRYGFGDMLISVYGIEYIENKLGISKTLSGFEKAKYISEKIASWGWEQFKDIAVRTAAEILSKQCGI